MGNSNVKKIVIKPDQELTDLIRLIKNSKEDRLVLTFTEKADLLVSPINLKVLLEEADHGEKILVAQIIQNPAGFRNAKSAGIVTTDDSGTISEDLWTQAEETFSNRVAALQSQLKANRNSHQDPIGKGTTDDVVVDNSSTISPSSPTEIHFEDENPELTHVEELSQESTPEEKGDLEIDDLNAKLEGNNPEQKISPEEMTPFQKRVESALKKSQDGLVNKSQQKKVVSESGVSIALDSDIDDQSSAPKANSMVGKDFNPMTPGGMAVKTSKIPPLSGSQIFKPASGGGTTGGKSKGFNLKGFKFPAINKAALKKKGPMIAIPAGLIALLIIYLVAANAPYASAKIYIESRPVSVEETFTGKPDITEFNVEERMVQIKQEVVEKGRSDSRQTTQTARRGERASGIATVRCYIDGSVTIPSGTVVTAAGGLQFETQAEVRMVCPWQETVTLRAAAVGSEYNMQSGTLISVPGYTSNQVVMINDLAAFTGGSSEEYKVVGQGDIDGASADLQKSAYEEANRELREKAVGGWKLIDATIKNEMIGAVESDYPVGAETDIVNVTLQTKSTALYYKQKELVDVGEELLLEAARDQKLFDSSEDIELKLGDDIITEVSVESVEDNTVTLKVKSSGSVKPSVDRSAIIADLRGMRWNEGTKYLKDLGFTSDEPQYEFSPSWFPGFMWKFPNKQGRIRLTVEEVERPVEESSSEVSEGGE